MQQRCNLMRPMMSPNERCVKENNVFDKCMPIDGDEDTRTMIPNVLDYTD